MQQLDQPSEQQGRNTLSLNKHWIKNVVHKKFIRSKNVCKTI